MLKMYLYIHLDATLRDNITFLLTIQNVAGEIYRKETSAGT